ncbi:MAG: CoA pyrophosphatase [Flammeovirgaceae bacterium]
MQNFVEKLKEKLQKPLPGLAAQMKMSAPTRGIHYDIPEDVKKSAVLLLLFPFEGRIRLPLIKRPDYGGVHSGQMALPGGKIEEGDISLMHTALRETHEEIGVKISPENVLGKLTDLYVPPSNSLVSPYIAFIEQRPTYRLAHNEVAKLIESSIEHLQHPLTFAQKEISIQQFKLKVPAFVVEEEIVWGATAMIISEFLEIIK